MVERNPVRQARARRTCNALLAAARDVFSESGFDATQTPDIAAAAGVSVGTFYRYFSDKRAIFVEVIGQELSRTYAEVMAKLTPERLGAPEAEQRHTIAAALAIVFEHIDENAKLMRVLEEVALRDPVVAKLRREFDDDARARIAELCAAVCATDVVPDPQATACVIHTAVVGSAAAVSGAHGPPPVDRDRAISALTDLIYRTCFSPA